MVSNIFNFHPYLGKWSNLTNIFRMGWNHQLDTAWICFCWWFFPDCIMGFIPIIPHHLGEYYLYFWVTFSRHLTRSIHLWYICLHLVDSYGKCSRHGSYGFCKSRTGIAFRSPSFGTSCPPWDVTGEMALTPKKPWHKSLVLGCKLSNEKNPPTFHYTGWLIGILIMAYYNPYITG